MTGNIISETAPVQAVSEQAKKDVSALDTLSSVAKKWPDGVARCSIIALALSLAWFSWAHWGDIQIDCGRELYVPMEMLRGKLLYRDIFYPYGPLAPCIQALLLGLFGFHLVVLYLLGLSVAMGCALLLFEIGNRLSGRAVGLTASFAILLMGFAPTIFNYVFPYGYAASLGLFFSFAAALFVVKHGIGCPGTNLFLAGLFASLAILSKQEFGIASYAMLGFLIVGEALLHRSRRDFIQGLEACLPGMILWLAIYGFLFWSLTPRVMIDDNWIGTPGTYSMRTYGATLYSNVGMRFNAKELVLIALSVAATLILWRALTRLAMNLTARQFLLGLTVLGIGLLVFRILVSLRSDFNIVLALSALVFPRGMFPIGAAYFVYLLFELRDTSQKGFLGETAFCVFALATSIRVFANVVPFDYSIYYAAPLFLIFVLTLVRCLHMWTSDLPMVRQNLISNLILTTEIVLLAVAVFPLPNGRDSKLETSWGSLYLRPDDAAVGREFIAFLKKQKQLGARVAIVPEAPMLYAFSDMEAPSRWYTLLPGLLSPEQELVYIADLKRTAPEYIVVTCRNTAEYGAAYFGIDYDKQVYRWIETNYQVTRSIGTFRLDGSRVFAALVFKKRNTSSRQDKGM